eukprot:m.57087 g.57087  ORF g.57087 m.57087 type:complete len:71 (+) comp48995_c0_seq2:480-692(+)
MVAARWRHRLRVVRVKQARAASAAATAVAANEMDRLALASLLLCSRLYFDLEIPQPTTRRNNHLPLSSFE